MARRQITLDDVSAGNKLLWDVYASDGRLLLRRGHVFESDSQLETWIERGIYADTEFVREVDENEARIEEQARPTAYSKILRARRLLEKAFTPNGMREKFPEQILRIRELISEACQINSDVALAIIVLHREGRYSIRHQVDTAIMCHAVGSALGVSAPDLTATVAAALTMNISMLMLQDRLQNQAEPLAPEQREAIQQHPVTGEQTLREVGVADDAWLAAAMNHHEMPDGSGYPAQKKGGALPRQGQLITLSDVYCALVSGRDYRPPMLPNTALRTIYMSRTAATDKVLAGQFIKILGIYPPGTAVRLLNGEIAVVSHQGQKANTPYVHSVVGPRGAPLSIPIKRDTSNEAHVIREVVAWTELGPPVNMQAIWGKDAAI